jgi:hypothetical protein
MDSATDPRTTSTVPKPIPAPKYELLFPPVFETEAFRYFENGRAHPFRPDATDLELVNAWWLAEASLLAYAPAEFAVESFRAAGLDAANLRPFQHEGTQCYVAFGERLVIVAFRGTQVLRPDRWSSLADAWNDFRDALRDARTDGRFALTELTPGSGQYVHRGFLAALDGVWPAVEAQLEALQSERPSRTFWFTGHSLGAALATLAAQRFQNVRGLYTFGSPLVGDRLFAAGLRIPAFRFVHNNDLVARVPPIGPHTPPKLGARRYQHIGRHQHIDALGRLLDDPGFWRLLVDRIRGHRLHLAALIRHLFTGHLWALAPDDLNDHAPLFYALRVWNVYEASLARAAAREHVWSPD